MRATRFRYRSSLFTAIAVALVLVALHAFGLLQPFTTLVGRVLAPVQQRLYFASTWFSGSLRQPSTSDLAGKTQQLEEQVQQLLVENAQLRAQLGDAGALEEQRSFLMARGLRAVEARIIARTPEPSASSLILNRGYRDGIEVGAAVITGQGLLIGKIIAVDADRSYLRLINDSRSRVAARLEGGNQSGVATTGVVNGERGLSLRLELIPQGVQVEPAMVVVTSGLELGVPPGLIIGQIDQLEESANAFFQVATIEPLVDLDQLTVVSVLTVIPVANEPLDN